MKQGQQTFCRRISQGIKCHASILRNANEVLYRTHISEKSQALSLQVQQSLPIFSWIANRATATCPARLKTLPLHRILLPAPTSLSISLLAGTRHDFTGRTVAGSHTWLPLHAVTFTMHWLGITQGDDPCDCRGGADCRTTVAPDRGRDAATG